MNKNVAGSFISFEIEYIQKKASLWIFTCSKIILLLLPPKKRSNNDKTIFDI